MVCLDSDALTMRGLGNASQRSLSEKQYVEVADGRGASKVMHGAVKVSERWVVAGSWIVRGDFSVSRLRDDGGVGESPSHNELNRRRGSKWFQFQQLLVTYGGGCATT